MDFDADGDLDILSGSYTGEVYYFECTASGEFLQGRYLTDSEGAPLQAGTSITPEALDVDADGDLDLIIGTRTSGVFVVANGGTRSEPSWAVEPTRMETRDGEDIDGSNAHHADWDGDGRRDLIVGSEWGGVRWHRNLGENERPSYAAAQVLVARRPFEERSESEEPVGPGSRTKVHVTDWNGDGLADLLVGDVQWLYETLPPLTEEELARKAAIEPEYDALREAYDVRVEERNSYVGEPGGIPEEVLARYRAASDALKPLSRKMAAFRRKKSHTHGWVWLYLSEPEQATGESAADIASGTAVAVEEPVARREFGPARLELFAAPLSQTDSLVRVRLVLTLDDGWHAYETAPPGSGYIPMKPSLDLPDGVQLARDWRCESWSIPARSGRSATWFEDQVEFTCDLRLLEASTEEVGVQVDLQVCDDKTCLPPTTVRLSLGKVVRQADSTTLRLARLDAMLPRFVKRWIPSKGSSIMPIGSKAPDFCLTDDRGVQRRASDFAGKRYLLWFYPKAGTPG
ncbi:MAG: FG-GAP-like repeat-containing protein [Planctomycetota bacterium]|nr:FG-GAP-like repeat-containing protein [Planctomycetota bacterium]